MKYIIRAFFVVVILLFVFSAFVPYTTQDTVIITVTDKERIVENSGDSVNSKYLVFTETEVFENTDSLMVLKFNSSDIQAKLMRGETYTVRVYGWRVPVFSWYRNIIEIKD